MGYLRKVLYRIATIGLTSILLSCGTQGSPTTVYVPPSQTISPTPTLISTPTTTPSLTPSLTASPTPTYTPSPSQTPQPYAYAHAKKARDSNYDGVWQQGVEPLQPGWPIVVRYNKGEAILREETVFTDLDGVASVPIDANTDFDTVEICDGEVPGWIRTGVDCYTLTRDQIIQYLGRLIPETFLFLNFNERPTQPYRPLTSTPTPRQGRYECPPDGPHIGRIRIIGTDPSSIIGGMYRLYGVDYPVVDGPYGDGTFWIEVTDPEFWREKCPPTPTPVFTPGTPTPGNGNGNGKTPPSPPTKIDT